MFPLLPSPADAARKTDIVPSSPSVETEKRWDFSTSVHRSSVPKARLVTWSPVTWSWQTQFGKHVLDVTGHAVLAGTATRPTDSLHRDPNNSTAGAANTAAHRILRAQEEQTAWPKPPSTHVNNPRMALDYFSILNFNLVLDASHVNNPRMALDSFALPSSSPSILDLDGRAGRRRHLLLCQQRRPGLLGRRAGASIDGQAQQATGRRLDRLQAGQTRQAQESSRFRGGQAPDEWMAQSADLEGVQRASSYSGTG
ncbi:unnamed protein product [Tilletia controversa]|nr:unnamed protein product [Tilletia controversa]